jgi:predicted ATPase
VLEALGRLCQGPQGQHFIALLDRIAPSWLVQLPTVLEVRDYEALQRRTLGVSRERMIREAAEALEAITAERTLILWLEDLHWGDVSTLDLLAYVARQPERARLLVLATYRPVDVIVRAHPLKTLKQELQLHGQCQGIPLEVLSEAAVEAYLAQRFTSGLPTSESESLLSVTRRDLARVIHQRTEGHPLFMVAVVEQWLAQGLLVNVAGHWEVRTKLEALQSGVPPGLQQMIAVQLDRLTTMERRTVEVGSVAGVEFSAAAVAAGLGTEVVEAEAVCAELARRELVLRAGGEQSWPDGTVAGSYGFVHGLYQEVLYVRVPAAQRADWHRRIGQREEAGYGVRGHEIAARLAQHFTQGRDYARAVKYLRQAGENALRRSAYREASALLTQGLELLAFLPPTPERMQAELRLQLAYSSALIATKSYAAPELEQLYRRVQELCQQMEKTPRLFSVLNGVGSFYYHRAQFPAALELAQQQLQIAQSAQDPRLLVWAHFSLGITLAQQGELVSARTHFEQGLVLYDPHQRGAYGLVQDPEVSCLVRLGLTLWLLGYADQALQRSREALTVARELAHPFTLTYALAFFILVHYLRGEWQAAQERIEELTALSHEHTFAYHMVGGAIWRGWQLVVQGQQQEGIAQIRQGLRTRQATGVEVWRTSYLVLLAEVCGNMGRTEEGLTAVAEALTLGDQTGDRSCEVELYRLKGELTLQQESQNSKGKSQKSKVETDPQGEAEVCFLKAIDIARRQEAKSLELRAILSLARLWQRRGKKAKARQMLAKIYDWFTEGFDTADLREAQVLLNALT